MLVCPICLSSRTYDDLNYRPCVKCILCENPSDDDRNEVKAAEPVAKRIRIETNDNIIGINVDATETASAFVSLSSSTTTRSPAQSSSMNGITFKETSNGTLISSFEQSQVLHHQPVSNEDMVNGCDTEGKTDPFLEEEPDSDEDMIPCKGENNVANAVNQDELTSDEMQQLKAKELKEELSKRNLTVSGKKSDFSSTIIR